MKVYVYQAIMYYRSCKDAMLMVDLLLVTFS